MTTTLTSKSAAVRARLNHPVIDSDGHTIEFEPAVMDYLKQVGGTKIIERYKAGWITHGGRSAGGLYRWYRLSPEERREQRATRPPWWALPAKNTLDRATAMLPKLLYERLDDFGLDVTVLYPSLGLYPAHLEDEELRRAACRAFNLFYAETYREYADRIIPVAIIPMHTPQEAIEELEYAVKVLGMKAVMMPSHVVRPIPVVARTAPDLARYAYWLDTYGLDSEYDYDPVWAKCVELKIPPTFHSNSMGWGSRTTSNYMYNHVGQFAAAGEAVCKALFFGGVTRRFPSLKFAFLEGGVSWAASVYADLFGHWEKRNPTALENLNPANLNTELLLDLCRRYGGKLVEGRLDQLEHGAIMKLGTKEDPALLDEWRLCGIEKAEDIYALFVPHFYFGCEADDPMNAMAFNTKANPFGARLQAIFGSDIGHWDVPDMTEVTEEAYELVEHGVITEEEFRVFVFINPVALWTGINPDFFKGTVIEKDVEKLLAENRA